MLDILQALFWTLAYITSDIYVCTGKKKINKLYFFPAFACICNFAWESVALARDIFASDYNSPGFFIHLSWFVFDIFIVRHILVLIKKKKSKTKNNMQTYLFYITYIFLIIIFNYVFKIQYGMLISSFVIDLSMAADFVAERKILNNDNVYGFLVAAFKLLGDVFTWVCYFNDHLFVKITGFVVLILNSFYFVYVLLKYNKSKKQRNLKNKKSTKKRKS